METSATTQSATTTSKQARTPKPMNGVDTLTLFATIGAVKGQPELASFQFRATNRWQQGTHSRTRIEGFHGAGGEHEHALASSATTRITWRSWSGATRVPRRSSSCSTRSRLASPPGSATSPPRAA